jgi:SAM-dependent methyltransferase
MTDPATKTSAPTGALLESAYWDRHWARSPKADRYTDLRWLRGNYSYVVLDSLLKRILPRDEKRSFIELGSGPGRWLVYFHRTFGYRVAGCDDSPEGCEVARATLAATGIDGTIVEGDFFKLTGQYDVVFSGGVIEHFEDPSVPLKAFARLVRPGGFLVTSVPNIGGVNGFYHRVLKPETFSTHTRITLAQLRGWHTALGLQERLATSYGSFSLLRMPGDAFAHRPRVQRYVWGPAYRVAAGLTSRACFMLHRRGRRLDHPVISPNLLVVAQDPRPYQG